ncbi:Transcriptional regulator, contains XRE-family HTH domain [Rhizobium tibeticum]|uniref:Transcriptional regulator, contains XRE-family HTH domain n=2 Tax=Rhizobium tibeticum TaxID=501024 RepID=A0A1H8V5B2_9HYPH|nr:transcriptional repressor DicA [Rhizobium tibeticum]SEP10589.1 Transcriptional regulator, contains XRE-family HTH domain [Rhizobium tibeticum]
MQHIISVKTNRFGADSKDKTSDGHIVDTEVGRRIKKRRQQLRISQTALGVAVGVSFQQIQKYERGANRVSSSILYQVAQILGVPITYFFESLPTPSSTDNAGLSQKALLREEFVATEEGQRLVDAFLSVPKKMRPKFIALLASFEAND